MSPFCVYKLPWPPASRCSNSCMWGFKACHGPLPVGRASSGPPGPRGPRSLRRSAPGLGWALGSSDVCDILVFFVVVTPAACSRGYRIAFGPQCLVSGGDRVCVGSPSSCNRPRAFACRATVIQLARRLPLHKLVCVWPRVRLSIGAGFQNPILDASGWICFCCTGHSPSSAAT